MAPLRDGDPPLGNYLGDWNRRFDRLEEMVDGLTRKLDERMERLPDDYVPRRESDRISDELTRRVTVLEKANEKLQDARDKLFGGFILSLLVGLGGIVLQRVHLP